MKKHLPTCLTFLFICAAILSTHISFAQTTYTVPAANTNAGSVRFPLAAVNGYERTAILFNNADLGAYGTVTEIGWYVNSLSSPAASVPIQIYMKTRTGNFNTGATTVATELTGAVLVYSGNITSSMLTASNWVTLVLNTPYNYLNNNLEVIVLTNYGGTGSGETTTSKQMRYATKANFCQTWTGNTTAPTGTGTVVNTRPNTQLKITPLATMTYASSNVTQPTLTPVAISSTNQMIARVNVVASGVASPAIDLNDITISTNGTTSLSDISNLKVFYTGSTNTFATTTQFGSTVSTPATSQVITGTQTLGLGNNYFWITYDINPGATAGDSIDVEVPSLTVDFISRTPTTTAPAGKREIQGLQTYSTAFAMHPDTSVAARGSANIPILRVGVVTSSSGFPINLTQLDLNTNGTTDTSNISNIKVWYTGNSKIFATTTQFGTTLASLPGITSFTVTGTQALLNDTNYFWLSYDIAATAMVGNILDAECTNVTVAGTPYATTTSAPLGNRKVGLSYCTPTYTNSCSSNDFIKDCYTSGGTTNISNMASGCNGQPDNFIYYPLQVLTIKQGSTFTINLKSGASYDQGFGVWIDYNQDGDFADPGEYVKSFATSTALNTSTITIPCDALAGSTRMRVRCEYGATPAIGESCLNLPYGETEDYPIIIQANPVAYVSSSAIQQTGTVVPGTNNIAIFKIPVKTNGCGVGLATTFYFNTVGTTSAADLVAAKIYSTGNSNTFSTTKQVGIAYSPNGQFVISTSDTLSSDTTFYWLTYDISAGTLLGHVIDARVDSMEIIGSFVIPANNNPAGNILVDAAATFMQMTAQHTILSRVERGASRIKILRIPIIMSSVGSPVPLTSLTFSTNGSSNPSSNIDSATVWYTGSAESFTVPVKFGTSYVGPSGTFTITGSQNIAADTSYLWLLYDLKTTALVGDSIDAELTSVILDGLFQSPVLSAPNGARRIISNYCLSAAGSTDDDDIGKVILTSGSTTILSNGNCLPSTNNTASLNLYTNYTSSINAADMNAGASINFDICQINQLGHFDCRLAIYIDINQNGLWDAGEMVYSATSSPNAGISFTGNFAVPINAMLGETRMRIVLQETTTNLTLSSACGVYNWGETEDYTVNILPALAPTTYTWNNAAGGNFTTATNWTPTRTNPAQNDRLIFNLGGTFTASSFVSQTIKSLIITNNTNVSINAPAGRELTTTDTLNITAGSSVKTNNGLVFTAGIDSVNTGSVVVAPGTLKVALKRWINASTSTIDFPVADTSGADMGMSLVFTTAPAASGTLTAKFNRGASGNNGLPVLDGGINCSKTWPLGYWSLTAANGLTGGAYTGNFIATNITGINTSSADLRVLARTNSAAAWTANGTHISTSGTSAITSIRSGMTQYGEFAFAADSAINPLPVSLINFTATALGNDVLLNWNTASEINNKGFDVERSQDGKYFSRIGFITGAGNSIVNNTYNMLDKDALTMGAVLFYRLKQIDMDGVFTYSNIVKVNTGDLNETGITIFPNPFGQSFNLELLSNENKNVTIDMVDVYGKIVFTGSHTLLAGKNAILFDKAQLSPGMYWVRVSDAHETKVLRLVKGE